MKNNNEIVRVELDSMARIELFKAIESVMSDLGFELGNYEALDLGFEIRPGWPVDYNCQPTMAELVVLAKKLGARVTITDLNFSKVKNAGSKCQCHKKKKQPESVKRKLVSCNGCRFRYEDATLLDRCRNMTALDRCRTTVTLDVLGNTSDLCYMVNVNDDCEYFEPTLLKRICGWVSRAINLKNGKGK